MPVARIAVSGMPARISQIIEICEIVLENSDDWNLSEDADWEREAQQFVIASRNLRGSSTGAGRISAASNFTYVQVRRYVASIVGAFAT